MAINTHFGCATCQQGRKLYYEKWQDFTDEIGVFTTNWNAIPPKAPRNWSTKELQIPSAMNLTTVLQVIMTLTVKKDTTDYCCFDNY